MKSWIKNILNRVSYVKGLKQQVDTFKANAAFPPGHFYSPIVSVDEIKEKEDSIWEGVTRDGIPGIELNTEAQLQLVNQLSRWYPEIPFGKDGASYRYSFDNGMYSYTDGTILYTMMRHLAPKRIVEIGSGHSSALMLDVNELHFNKEIQLTFIEPYPKRLYETISAGDSQNANIIEAKVQEVALEVFDVLEAGDILFVDSTHVSKCGSDVNHILFTILPRLKKGVFIHFHDIFYPFEYPREWVYEGYNWNENYLLKAFLMYNPDFEIRLFAHYLHTHHADCFAQMPHVMKNTGGNIWIEKVN